MTDNFKSVLENILKKDKRLVDDSGELNGNLIHEYASSLDEGLIDLLLNEEATREKFFLKVKDVYVFKQNDFKFFLDENKIDNSYTQYANRIGLSTGGKFLKDIDDVVLDFPYKDCVLEGGQSTEEGTDTYFEYDEKEKDYIEKEAKRKEIFFNQILAKDEIDRLTEPKAFNNIKRYTEKGEEKITSFNRDAKGQITDNLIIKGNNLLALHALKEQFQGKIKLIYIDPPFNTGNDSFQYNDKFNHSTWLTFMRNRLYTAKQLLKNDGFIFINLDDVEEAYARVLTDEIFGTDNFINVITVKSSTPSGTKTAHKDKTIIKQKDLILVYRKSSNARFIPQYKRKDKWDTHFNYYLDRKEETVRPLIDVLIENQILPTGSTISEFDINNKIHREFYLNNSSLICQTQSHKNQELKEKSRKLIDKVLFINKNQDNEVMFYNGRQLTPLSKSINEVIFSGKITKDISMLLCDFWDDVDFQNTQHEGGVSFPTAKKPELLLSRIIELATNENDIVLDYHLGSGTTSSVALKSKRQFIGIEQLDYGENDCVKRLVNVINGEQSGVSKPYSWKGGGSFVYCELAKNNQKAIDKIMSCNSLKELITLFDELYEKYFLNYNVKVKEFKEKIIKEKEFQNLSIDRQKVIFARMLDLNQLYVNVSDMEDSQFKLSDEDIALTKNFYQI